MNSGSCSQISSSCNIIVLLGRREIVNLSTTPFDSCQLLKHDVKTFMYPKKMLSMQAALKLEI